MHRFAIYDIIWSSYSKFHQSALAAFASLKDLQVLVTDDRISDEDRDYLRDLGIRLVIT